MLDLFGRRKNEILALPDFQYIVSTAKDLKTIIHGMSNGLSNVCVTPKTICTEVAINLTFSDSIWNDDLRNLLNDYYDKLYGSKPYSFHYDEAKHSGLSMAEISKLREISNQTEAYLEKSCLSLIDKEIFRKHPALHERYKNLISDFVHEGFGIPERYIPSDDSSIPFSQTYLFNTGLSNKYPNGQCKSDSVQQDEVNYYVKILLSQI